MKIWKRKTPGSFLVAISISVVIAGAAFLVISARSRAAASKCMYYLEVIRGAKYQWAKQLEKPMDAKPTWDDICWYTGVGSTNECPFRCPSGGTYVIGKIGDLPICPVHGFVIFVGKPRSREDESDDVMDYCIPGAVVETVWSNGHKVKTRTDAIGDALVKAPPNQTTTVIISKPGYVTATNSIEKLYFDEGVALEPVRK